MLGHKTSLHKLKVVEITWNTFFPHNGIQLEINNKDVSRKITNISELNSTHLNKLWIKGELTREIRKYFEIKEYLNKQIP